MPFLEVKNISKSFGSNLVLSNINFSLEQADILGLCGENGAGKSTLMKILSGVYPASSYTGDIVINEQVAHFTTILDAEKMGIAIIPQELNLVAEMSVLENIYLGRFLTKGLSLDYEAMTKKFDALCLKMGLVLNPFSKIKELGTGEKQMVEIIKAISKDAKILILDEPTSSLTDNEIDKLMVMLKNLQKDGLTAIYISHKLNEVFHLCNKVVVLRDGHFIAMTDSKATNKEQIIQQMVGRAINLTEHRSNKLGSLLLEAKDFTLTDRQNSSLTKVTNASFSLHEGEILGFAGLIGAGRTELMTAIYGTYEASYAGSVYLHGNKIKISSPLDAINHGIVYLTEERKLNGLVLEMSIKHNVLLSSLSKISRYGVIDNSNENKLARSSIEQFRAKISSIDDPISSLSGGNQQKILLSRGLLLKPKVLILDEPTRGIDVGAKAEIYEHILKIAATGTAVILVSSELPELLNLSTRIVVMHEGQIKACLDNQNLTQTDIMNIALGASYA